ncbi:MAG: ABC-F type ribosomal protection protein [Defluviitaleaceae bacterium]|nr:ABC-F type ribosomal protection protein [Defluviitaleaceae bacterium]MCL2239602.1 ABC-F type ribosomal protection protein [Defluviitaleaceae bacterium]
MSQINITNLTFAYEGSHDNIFENVSFQIDTDWKLGFTGRNGRGKTTFLHLLLGKYEYSGSIATSVQFQYFPHHVADKTADTQTVIHDIAPASHGWEVARELSLLEVADDVLTRPFETLSNGEQTKVLLAALFLNEHNFLLIDEPTNHLDINGRAIVSRYLNGKSGYILVSHDRAFLDGCVDHILSINRANIEVQRGNFSSWWENKKRADEFELAENQRLKKEIKRLKKAARQSAHWADKVEATKMGKGAAAMRKKGHAGAGSKEYSAEQSRRMQQRRKNLERRQQSSIEDKSKLLKNIERSDVLKISQLDYHKHKLLSLAGIKISYGDKAVCENISFTIEKGDRCALQGKNGSGKTSILKLICGESLSFSGDLDIGAGLKISYVSQDTSNLSGNLTDYALQHDIDESLFKAILRKLDFSRVQFEKSIETFSGGQKKKVLIAKSLCDKAHLLVWDEPLNFIDVLSRMQIEKLLLEYAPTILFVEHDSTFNERISTKLIVL